MHKKVNRQNFLLNLIHRLIPNTDMKAFWQVI